MLLEAHVARAAAHLIDLRKHQAVADGHRSDVDRCLFNRYNASCRCVLNWSLL
jgi:thioredoxin reductase